MNETYNYELSDPYLRVKKIYIFFSALLLFWEFLGINIYNVSNSGININIDAPHVVPSILFLIVAYFGYRLYIEWVYHSNQPRAGTNRVYRLQNLDYYLSQIFGLFSIVIYFTQNTFDFQIVELFVLDIAPTFALIVIIIYFILSIAVSFINLKRKSFNYKNLTKNKKSFILLRIAIIILFMPMVYYLGLLTSVKIYFIGLTTYYMGYFLFKAFKPYS